MGAAPAAWPKRPPAAGAAVDCAADAAEEVGVLKLNVGVDMLVIVDEIECEDVFPSVHERLWLEGVLGFGPAHAKSSQDSMRRKP